MPRPEVPAWLWTPLSASINRLELSLDPSISLKRLKHYPFTWKSDGQYLFLIVLAVANLLIAQSPGLLGKLLIVAAYSIAVLIPLSSQFVFPATPIFSWLLLYWSARWTVAALKLHIWVSILPTLESVLYGANISDILTRYTSSVLDILAWLPYGLIHFSFPFIAAALIWIFGPPGAVKFFAKVFGYVNIIGVMCQIAFPCTPPWYELIYGQGPANWAMKGSPGGLARIDAIFHNNAYTVTFTNSPIIFGAFPSLHAGCATTDALLLNHFFPKYRALYLFYVLWLYWSTMYLTHHYLIDVVAGASLAVGVFYFFLSEDPNIRDWSIYATPGGTKANRSGMLSNGGIPVAGDDVESGHGPSASRGLGESTGGAEDFELPALRRDSNVSSSAASSAGFNNTKDSLPPPPLTVVTDVQSVTSQVRVASPRLHGSMSLGHPKTDGGKDDALPRPRTPRIGDK